MATINVTDTLQVNGVPVLVGARGQTTLTWTASTLSATNTISHGLGVTPTAVVATSFNAGTGPQVPYCNTFTYSSTQFSINGVVPTSGTFTTVVSWVAIV